MKKTTLHIRDMCCIRCVEAVTEELQSLGLEIEHVKLGEAVFFESRKVSLATIEKKLNKRGFLLAENKEEEIVENVKTAIWELIERLAKDEFINFTNTQYLEEKAKIPYRQLHAIFSKHKKMSIEKYFILQKIEKVKDLIESSGLQFSEIAFKMGYKSLQHLSGQFKKVAGMSMTDYQSTGNKSRKFINEI